MSQDGLVHHKTLADLEKHQKTVKKIKVIHGVQSITRFMRKVIGIPEPHDKFTPYEQLTPVEQRNRVKRIRKEHKARPHDRSTSYDRLTPKERQSRAQRVINEHLRGRNE